jgi:hypothetical protein
LTGVAVKVTDVPEQMKPCGLAAIVTDGVTLVTVIVMLLLVTDTGFAQGALLVSTAVTTSPLTSEDVVKLPPPVPALTPFTFH